MSSPVSEKWQVVDESSWGVSNDPVISAAVTTDETSSESEIDSDEDVANQILGMSLNDLGWRMQVGLLPKKQDEPLSKKLDKLSDNIKREAKQEQSILLRALLITGVVIAAIAALIKSCYEYFMAKPEPKWWHKFC